MVLTMTTTDTHVSLESGHVCLQHDMMKRSHVVLSASRRGALGAKKHVLLAEVDVGANCFASIYDIMRAVAMQSLDDVISS
jgi:hypothetical protein